MDNLELYNNEKIILEKTCPNIIIIWFVILSTVIFMFIIIISIFEFDKSKIYNAYLIKEGDEYFAKVYTEINNMVKSYLKFIQMKN